MTNYEDLINADTMSLEKYLKLDKDNIFLIPFSQRSYEWGNQEVKRLFNDLTSLYDNQEIHMLNFFTFSRNEDGNLRIFDGQQRTVSCLLILAVIAQRLYKQGQNEAAQQISESYFLKTDKLHQDSDVQRKLVFDSDDDNEYFYKVTNITFDSIADFDKGKDLNPNQKAIKNNIKYINKLLDSFIQGYGNKVELIDLFNSITERTLLVQFVAKTEEVALSMFESLNNTGKSIEKYYVLKNDMVKCLGEEEVKPSWTEIDINLGDLNHNEFLNATATIFMGKTTSSKVLPHLYSNTHTSSKGEMRELLKLLKEVSDNFLKICNPSQMDDANKSILGQYREYSEELRLFNVKQHRPIILAMLMTGKALQEVNSVLEAVVELTVKNFYFGNQKANTIEKKFADYAKAMYDNELSTDVLLSKIRKQCISGSQLKDAIKRKNINQNPKVSFILRKTYNFAYRRNELEVSSSNNDVEHILPRTPAKGSKWLQWYPDDEVRQEYTYNIGNLTLWLDKDNRGTKNADFEDKRKKYEDSGLKENQSIAKNETWTVNEINNRSDYMADEIIQAFSAND